VYSKPTSGLLGSTSAEGQRYERPPFGVPCCERLPCKQGALSGGRRASVAIRDHWSMALEPRRNARRTDAVEMAENIANGGNMSERPVFEWMAPIGYAVRGKTGLAG
jgi:hypothetical protein